MESAKVKFQRDWEWAERMMLVETDDPTANAVMIDLRRADADMSSDSFEGELGPGYGCSEDGWDVLQSRYKKLLMHTCDILGKRGGAQ